MNTLVAVSDQHDCRTCQLAQYCLSARLEDEIVAQVSQLVHGLAPLERGRLLYSQGDPRDSYFVLRSGTAKSVYLDVEEREEVIAFHYPGDLIGIGSIGQAGYTDTVVLLERSSLCEIPVAEFDGMCERNPVLHRIFIDRVAREVGTIQHARLRLTHTTAEERVADFLLEISRRMHALRRCTEMLNLTMSRQEIGSYLGLAAETVSRTMRQFEALGLIRIRGKQTLIADMPGLRAKGNPLLAAHATTRQLDGSTDSSRSSIALTASC